jgi:CubicO group peptidase (beta-lactamase class C family)
VAACALLLVDRGALMLDEPVARHWPEFGASGKEEVTVRQLLSHQAGLVVLREPAPTELLFDWDALVHRLEAEPPWWPPGTAHGEHAYFYGHLIGELVRRVDGRPFRASCRTSWRGPGASTSRWACAHRIAHGWPHSPGWRRSTPEGWAASRGRCTAPGS